LSNLIKVIIEVKNDLVIFKKEKKKGIFVLLQFPYKELHLIP